MDNIKSIISNNEGQRDYNFLPPSVIPATYIKGKKGSTPITMQGIQYPMIALDKYGVTFQQPDQQYNYKSKGVLEMPYIPGSTKKDDEMPKAQQGGSQEQQIQQLIAMYAQMKGVSPEEIIKQLQQLPKEQQQKALESIAQEVQQAMAQQQQQQMAQQQQAGPEQQEAMMGQQDQEGMMEQEQEMAGQGMMSYGGEPCIECFDNYNPSPQAQNLNWYYKKAKGGLTGYQDEGEVDEPRYNRFDDALHNLPIWNKAEQNILNKYAGLYSNRESDEYGYDNLLEKIRPDISNPRHVLMEKIKYPWQQISNPYVDREFDNNATSSEGYFYNQSDMTPEEIRDRAFDDNLKLKGLTRGTGLMPYKYETPDELNQGLATGGEAFRQANTYPEDWGSYHGNQYAIGGNTVLQSDPNAQTYLPYMRKGETRPNFMFAEGGDTTDQWGGQSDIDRAYQMMKKGGFAMNPKKKKGGKFNHLDEFRKYLEKGGGLPMAQKGMTPWDDEDDINNAIINFGRREDTNPIQNNAYQKMLLTAQQNSANSMNSNFGSPTAGKKVPLTNPYLSNEDITNMIKDGVMVPVQGTFKNGNLVTNKTNNNSTINGGNNQTPNTSNTTNTNNTKSSNTPSGNQYVGNVNADNYTITKWNNGNIKKIKGTPNRPQSNVTWNTPGAAYIQGAANSRLFGTSGLGLALSTITGALNPNVAPSTGSTFKAKYRPDGSLRKVKGSASDVYNFFNPNAAGTNNTTSSTTTPATTTTGSTTTPSNTYIPKGFGSSLYDDKISFDMDPATKSAMDDMNFYKQWGHFRKKHGGAHHYLPMALMGIPSDPFDAGNGSVDDLNKMNSSSSQDWNEYAIKENDSSRFDYTSNRQASDPGKDVRVRITERSGFGTPNKKAIQAMGAILGAANAGLDAKAANRKQDAYINSMENRDTTSNMAFNTGNATQTQFGSPGAAVNDKRQVFPNGPGSNIPGGANYGTPLFNTGLAQMPSTRDGGSIHDRYEDGGEYDLTDEEIQEILAAGGSIQYI